MNSTCAQSASSVSSYKYISFSLAMCYYDVPKKCLKIKTMVADLKQITFETVHLNVLVTEWLKIKGQNT